MAEQRITLIAAMTNNRVIGKDNQMPWHLPADLQHFKQLTMGKPIIMGRKTFESIGKPLPGRRNIVLSRQKGLSIDGCETFTELELALGALDDVPEVMIIGGSLLFRQAISMADRLYLTIIDTELTGDAFFPRWEASEWQEVSNELHHADEKNPYDYRFIELQRN